MDKAQIVVRIGELQGNISRLEQQIADKRPKLGKAQTLRTLGALTLLIAVAVFLGGNDYSLACGGFVFLAGLFTLISNMSQAKNLKSEITGHQNQLASAKAEFARLQAELISM